MTKNNVNEDLNHSILRNSPLKDDFGILASKVVNDINIQNTVPSRIRDEIPTLNRMGYMKIDLDYFSKEFIKYAEKINDKVLDLGCAYGFVVKHVLENDRQIIACDLSPHHLEVLIKSSPQDKLDKLHVYPGKFPQDVTLPVSSIAAVLTTRMFHFLEGETIEKGLDKIYSWLKPAGKLFFTVVTPYNIAIKEGCLPTYLQRVKEGDKWPGVIENQWEINPAHKEYVEPYLHVFDIPQLEALLPKHGFKIEEINLFDYPNDVDSGGKGHVGLIAAKI